uniref:Uncharacterized protein n=1 Tax=Rhizophora mucronata TaxID=61149 RepID=A0A2P2IWP1_RHIMU
MRHNETCFTHLSNNTIPFERSRQGCSWHCYCANLSEQRARKSM